jgi:hypothetical protein
MFPLLAYTAQKAFLIFYTVPLTTNEKKKRVSGNHWSVNLFQMPVAQNQQFCFTVFYIPFTMATQDNIKYSKNQKLY